MKIYNTNLFLLTDLYELTMAQGYFFSKKNERVVFDVSFRKTPFGGGYIIFAGLQTLVEVLLNLKVTDEDIDYLKSLEIFNDKFLCYLKNFKFSGDIYSVEEGEIVFPKEPILRIHAPIIEAQIIESIVLNVINFQSLIATKTSRIVEVAKDKIILEFGLRRAQGIDGAISASRAAYIGGASATSNVLAGKLFEIPLKGTMAHSWVMSFENELEAFRKYSKLYKENIILLIDTYSTINSGIKNAIKVLKEVKRRGVKNFGIRLDSGDLETLSKKVRYLLDKAGLKEAKIVVSNELDEDIINQLLIRKSPIDMFGVGTKLITGNPDSSLSGVYKIVAKKSGGKYLPLIKFSDTPEKVSLPHIKNLIRFYQKGTYMCDMICLYSEKFTKNMDLYHPDFHYKIFRISDCKDIEKKIIIKKILDKGKLVYNFLNLKIVRENTIRNLASLPEEYKRLINPHIFPVGISKNLSFLKERLLSKMRVLLAKDEK
ncbi:MAG: nicotinate phosphoribosyltransferase [Endomicrobia bacterium]|nr:nicotinate phosphoribosyltransferase [Endomicrobiia bacterium]